MGRSHSKVGVPNNPFEVEQYKREMYEKRYRECEKELKKQKKLAEKTNLQQQKQKQQQQQQQQQSKTRNVQSADGCQSLRFNESDYDIEAKNRMQDQLAFDSQSFVLNQLMLAVQFYGNFEKEMWEAVERNRKQENEKTNKIEQHCKVVILPDRLHEAIDRRVKFKAKHGPSKGIVSSIHQRSLYIIHENIEITYPGEPAVYSIVTDAPLYKMEIDLPMTIEKRVNHVGYLRLKSAEIIRKSNGFSVMDSSMKLKDQESKNQKNSNEDEDEVPPVVNSRFRDSFLVHQRPKRSGNDQKNVYGAIANNNNSIYANPLLLMLNNSIGTQSVASSEYDYAYVTSLNTRQPLSIIKSSGSIFDSKSITTLPDECISNLRVASFESNNDDSGVEEHSYEIKQFLSSKEFLANFVAVFQSVLANELSIPKDDLSEATWQGATIYSKTREIIPGIACPWPKEAFEWLHRQRKVTENPITKQKFQWPTPFMVNKVTSFGCHVVPVGFTSKSAMNAQCELEWKIVFPEAVRYLESCLTSTQIKVYMITKVLLKTFVDPYIDAKVNSITTEHIRTHLFWQCEQNYAAWPEDYLGEALIRFLKSLLENIKKQKLSDFFLPRRNLFENVPEETLAELHKRIFRITENPVMYVLIAMRNLKFYPGMFPKINFKKLYSLIIIDNPLKIVNPMFRTKHDAIEEMDRCDDDLDEDTDIWDIYGSSPKVEQQHCEKAKKVKRVKFLDIDKISHKIEKNQRRFSTESIDVKVPIMKHMEQIRRVLLYETFITHYIEMVKALLKFQSWNQILIYLKQASRLCYLLMEDGRESEAQNYLSKIDTIHRDVMAVRNREPPKSTKPQLPLRQNSTDNIQIKLALINDPSKLVEKMSPILSGSKFEIGQAIESDPDGDDMHKNVIRSETATNVQIHMNAHKVLSEIAISKDSHSKRNECGSLSKSGISLENCIENDTEANTEL